MDLNLRFGWRLAFGVFDRFVPGCILLLSMVFLLVSNARCSSMLTIFVIALLQSNVLACHVSLVSAL